MAHIFVPTVVEGGQHFERSYDIYSLLLKHRVVFLNTPVTQESANVVVAQLLFLASDSAEEPIHFYISSPGGDMYSGFAIYDAMQMIEPPVYTYAVGLTASMGTVLLAAGARGRRYALPHATIHLHPATSGAQGYTEDVRIAFREQERVQTQVFHLLSKHTGHPWQEIERDFERDRWMHAVAAREYGLIDHILGDSSDVVVRLNQGEIELAGAPTKPSRNGASG
ncbi:MAG TPA: ATP-dependent Clp protease proteolytic subunit [Caldilineaceae bacterium]|nr:ATP-dependent Clp protease proteolytic subunit [Caldilineaceae bacterium]